ncbi:hypothetical protein FACS1894202_04610 [Clostridia bacterium]|nr:hypothetical protein FACS1894202_04610 [Clostridia bacterium]
MSPENKGIYAGSEDKLRPRLRKIFKKVPKEYQEEFRRQKTDTNVGRMYAFSIYIICLQVALNIINLIRPSVGQAEVPGGIQIEMKYYVMLSLFTLLLGIVYCILLRFAWRGKITNYMVKSFLVRSLLYGYVASQLAFCTLNILSSGGINSYIIAILIIGMVPVISPVHGLISIVASSAYIAVVIYLTRDVSQMWSTLMLTDTWTHLVIITGLTVCISIFIHDMYVANFLKTMALKKANRELEVMARTDQMTGVGNRRAMTTNLENIWNSSSSGKVKLVTAIADIDFFKSYNDTFGHLEGDNCLQKVASSLQASFRSDSDIVIRYGGEEFLIVFKTAGDFSVAFELLERARRNVEGMKIPHGRTDISPYVTVSIGACLVQPSTENTTSNAALKVADAALYESKNSGRNKTTMQKLNEL